MTEDSRNTAYPHNTRASRNVNASIATASRWHPKVHSLVQRDYSFLGYRYAGSGVLYRGMRHGLSAMLEAAQWLPSVDEGPLGALERELGVFLFSHDLSDALTVSRLWEADGDAAIMVFPAQEFDARWQGGEAAVLGFAEPGVVFKYPFFVQPLAIDNHLAMISRGEHRHPRLVAQIVLPEGMHGDRSATESWLLSKLRATGIQSAAPIEATSYPSATSTIASGA